MQTVVQGSRPYGTRAWSEEIRLDPNESCLAQRFRRTPFSEVAPAMIGNWVATVKNPKFGEEEKGLYL